MAHAFEIDKEILIEATPDQVWEAIATGPGVDSWFMGRNEIEPGVGGKNRMTLLGSTMESTVTAWEPSKRLAFRSEENPDGTFMAFEYLIEGRDQGTTHFRFVHSGFLGDDWEAEYDALTKGDYMYLQKLAAYLKHFPGRTATFSVFALGPPVADQERAWAAYRDALGLTGAIAEGDQVRLTVAGIAPADGVVEFAHLPWYLGVRTNDGLYTFMHGHQDTPVVEYHCFAGDVDQEQTDQAWQSWLTKSFS